MNPPNSKALELAERLEQDAPYTGIYEVCNEAAAELRRLAAENDKLKTVMVAAAEEISEHWDAHCDAEGYGPANLMRRLEDGIPSEYGYTAGAFATLKAERDRLAAENEALRADAGRWRMQIALDEEILRQPKFRKMQKCLDAFNEAFWDKGLIREAAIDAAIKDAAWSGVTTYMLGVTPEEEAEWQRKSDELDSRKP